jgi:hypothetical protein
MLPMIASVDIDPDFDNLQILFETVRKWVISDAGRQTKVLNEPGYQNVLLYGKAAKDAMEMQMMQQQQQQLAAQGGNGGAPPKKPNPRTAKEAPITENKDVQTVQ